MKKWFFYITIISCLNACTKESPPAPQAPLRTGGLEITYNCTCGWASRADSFYLNVDSVHFVQNARGWTANGDTIIDTSFTTPHSWLDSLYLNLDMTAFKNINYNQGGLGFDGCDIELAIRKDSSFHRILYQETDPLNGIDNFIFQLDSIWNEIGKYPPSTTP